MPASSLWEQIFGAGVSPQPLSDMAQARQQSLGDALDPTGQSSSSMAEDAWRWLKTGGYPHGGAAATPEQAAQLFGAYGGVAPPTQARPAPAWLPEAGVLTGSLPSQPGPQPRTSGATMAPIPPPAGRPATNDQLGAWLGHPAVRRLSLAPWRPLVVLPRQINYKPSSLPALLAARQGRR